MAFTDEQRAKATEARRAKGEERKRLQALAGIPDSKPFGGSLAAADNPILNCHVGGVLVRNMPMEAQGRILYRQTDEGIAEANEGKVECAARVTSDPLSNSIQQRRDQLTSTDMQPWEAVDPLREIASAHVAPGMRPKFLSPEVVKKKGNRGFEPVIKDGQPVKVGNLILAQMPEEKAQQRNRHYREQGQKMLQQVDRQYLAEGGRTAVADQ